MAGLGVLLLIIQGLTTSASASNFDVDTQWARIRGTEAVASNKKTYVAFRNIPYAKPPVGELRFAKPEPFPKQDDTIDATSEKIRMCPQPSAFGDLENLSAEDGGEEDCLILNVYTPKLDSVKRKVMVFIHGGGFIAGATREFESGNFVTEQGLILVTVNYRVGVFGFLSTENEASPGNYGLWDQNLALKWVKDNIVAFGGDADDITIAGESAGGGSVAFQTISPYAKGLFSKVYVHSGATTSTFFKSMIPQRDTLALAKPLGCWEGDLHVQLDLHQSKQVVRCLRKLPMSKLVSFSEFRLDATKFTPSIDGDFVPKLTNELLNDDDYLKSVGFFDRTYLIAINDNEFSLAKNSLTLVEKFIKMGMGNSSDEAEQAVVQRLHQSIMNYYITNRLEPASPSKKIIRKINEWYQKRTTEPTADLMTDLSMLIPTYDLLDALSRHETTKVWFLHFHYYSGLLKGSLRGSIHGLDLLYWSDISPAKLESYMYSGISGELDKEDLAVKTLFSGLLGHFVKKGDMTNALKKQFSVEWPIYDPVGIHYLDFSLKPRVKTLLEIEKKDFWLIQVPKWLTRDKQRDEL